MTEHSLESLIKRSELEWEVPIGYIPGMRVPGTIFLSESLKKTLEPGAVEQVANVATLPGIVRRAYAMPDIHWGYGFPIGGVAAFDEEEGIISPGGVGFDINCGVRLLKTPLTESDISSKKRNLIETLYKTVPTGVGSRSDIRISRPELEQMMLTGAKWAVKQGYGLSSDIINCEAEGAMPDADPGAVSDKARSRGLPQGGTLGSGNHFLEVQVVKQIYDPVIANTFGVKEGDICVMIHCGSRGLGHQVCTDNIASLSAAAKKYKISLSDRQLACAPVHSKEGELYYSAMAASANYAWANRQIIMHKTREVFTKLFQTEYDDMHLVYDVAHNVAKREIHDLNGHPAPLCVHRKGATRAFGPHSTDLPSHYMESGQPVIIPGSMGTSSFLLHGTKKAMDLTFGSTCHGAGRVSSRSKAKKTVSGKEVKEELLRAGIIVKAPNDASIAEESPHVYKSSTEVVRVVHELGISRLVARLEPLAVIKG